MRALLSLAGTLHSIAGWGSGVPGPGSWCPHCYLQLPAAYQVQGLCHQREFLSCFPTPELKFQWGLRWYYYNSLPDHVCEIVGVSFSFSMAYCFLALCLSLWLIFPLLPFFYLLLALFRGTEALLKSGKSEFFSFTFTCQLCDLREVFKLSLGFLSIL